MLKIAIIGTGGIAQAHLAGYMEFPEFCEVVALCDKFEDKAKDFKKKYSLEANVYSSYLELFEKETIDAISICLPPYLHREVAISALEAGIHVLCEKPMAPSVEECDAMLEAQRNSGKLLAICHQNRFRNDIREVKHVLDSGLMGEILFSRIDSFWWRSIDYYNLWWRGTWEKEGGGCVLNHSVHHLDLLLWFLGKPKTIYSLCANIAHNNSEVEDFGTALIRFENESLAQFTTSVMSHGEDQQLLFQCEKGKIVSPWEIHCSQARANGFPDGRDVDFEEAVIKERQNAANLENENHIGAVENFLKAIKNEEELLVTGIDGKNVIELITLFYQASIEKRELQAQVNKDNPWYTTKGILEQAPRYYEKKVSIDNMADDIVVGQSK